MNEKFNKNAKVEKLTNMLGIAVRLIVTDPLVLFILMITDTILSLFIDLDQISLTATFPYDPDLDFSYSMSHSNFG